MFCQWDVIAYLYLIHSIAQKSCTFSTDYTHGTVQDENEKYFTKMSEEFLGIKIRFSF